MKSLPIFFIFALICIQAVGQNDILPWESPFKYSVIEAQVPENWNLPAFNDALWNDGFGSVGFGDNDDVTLIAPTPSVYMRYQFSVNNVENFKEMVLMTDFDDGFKAYLNGGLIASVNLGKQLSQTTFDQLTDRSHEAEFYRNTPRRIPGYYLDSVFIQQYLFNGPNVLAVEVHNDSIQGSDLTFACSLVDITGANHNYYDPVFRYLADVEIDSTPLPILKIESDEYGIPYKHIKVLAQMAVIYDSLKAYQHMNDTAAHFNSQIRIEIKGESSSDFTKRSYNIETQNPDGSNLNFPLLGLPEENDWVLIGPYQDKSQIRNALVFDFGRRLGSWNPRYKFCELVLNGQNMGLYMLTERIKRDKNRINIATLNADELSGDDLTGGYIFKYDKGSSDIQIVYPDKDAIPWEQSSYIRDFWSAFCNLQKTNRLFDEDEGYRNFINPGSLIDYIIMSEIAKNADSYLYSTYMYKDKNSNDPRVHYGPLWDYDLAFGNTRFQDGDLTYNWQFEYNKKLNITRFLEDTTLVRELSTRWSQVRNSSHSNEAFDHYIDSMTQVLKDPLERNYKVWPLINKTLFFPNYVPENYTEEIAFIKNWMHERLAWIDQNINAIYYPLTIYQGVAFNENNPQVTLYPNPARETLYLATNATIRKLTIYDYKGSLIVEKSVPATHPDKSQLLIDVANYKSGLYILQLSDENGHIFNKKFIKAP